MKILETENSEKQKWNAFVAENKGEFLQSWEWGDFQGSTGKKIWRLKAVDDGEILGVALVIKHKMPLGRNYLYCPKGPILKNDERQMPNAELTKEIIDKIGEIAKKENSVFLRIESGEEISLGNGVSKYSASNIQPKDTLILDLTKSEDQLLAEMKQKTRYNIRLAEKHGVKVKESDKESFQSDFKKFWSLTEDTTSRDGFQSHPKEYYKKMLAFLYPPAGGGGEVEVLGVQEKDQNSLTAKIFLAEHEGKILAANIVIFFGARAVYLHGASSSENRNLMAPYLLQWEQIKKARQSGFKEYDFWGIDPRGEKNWGGITKFKIGFGGKEINYPQAMDIIYQPIVYKAINFAKRIRSGGKF